MVVSNIRIVLGGPESHDMDIGQVYNRHVPNFHLNGNRHNAAVRILKIRVCKENAKEC